MPPDPKKSMNPSWKQRTLFTDKEGVMRNMPLSGNCTRQSIDS